ncbi:MAG: PTS sugar transporter subunit IIA [Desulfatiglans sp.]|jgi:mannitol/fructose-specific phosphotransferase system IIA component (Ntr-type)|nr:PTS sugar transporter subunit IIA [Thermodesulfobacteriota bacterium]MEE4353214.1 PTS sugar transporter subunit IIA [Desulfatiglans sp.]
MKIYKRLRADHIFLDAVLRNKNDVFCFVAETFARDGVVGHARMLYASMIAREKAMSTGIGSGIGIPHAASAEARAPAMLLIRLAEPIDFEALDGLPVDIILALVVPENQTSLHLQILAGISRLCEKTEFLDLVRNETDGKALLEGIRRIEEGIAFH